MEPPSSDPHGRRVVAPVQDAAGICEAVRKSEAPAIDATTDDRPSHAVPEGTLALCLTRGEASGEFDFVQRDPFVRGHGTECAALSIEDQRSHEWMQMNRQEETIPGVCLKCS